jgi:ATP-dependent helicase/nuclease subunit B
MTDGTAKKTAVYTAPASAAFLESVAAGILAETAGDPLRLADYTILVPSRDIGFLLRQAFVEQLNGKPGVLPKIDAPGDMDDEYLSLRVAGEDVLSQTLMDIPPPVTKLERQLILAGEILKIPAMSSSVQKALKLAAELGHFLDDLQRNNIELKDVDVSVPPQFRDKWSLTADFLKILTNTWPQKLQDMGRVDPEEHKNALIQIQAAHWLQKPPSKPVVAVGFTDASSATVSLLQSVVEMPAGKIILPGFDVALDQNSWDALSPVHPQYAFRTLLSEIGVDRADVAAWGDAPDVASAAREKLLRETMRPAGTAEAWAKLSSVRQAKAKKSPANDDNVILSSALDGMDLIICGTPQEEASVIALKLRETLETQNKTAMFVTEDRSLAARVAARLERWKIEVQDGAGMSLSDTAAGIFLLSTARMAADEWAPVASLVALKHPLATLGEEKDAFRQKLTDFEDLVYHGPRPLPGADGARRALTAAFNRAAKLPKHLQKTPEETEAQKQRMFDFVTGLETAGGDFFRMMGDGGKKKFSDLLDAHIGFVENLAADPAHKGAERIWRGDDGVKASRFLTRLRASAALMPNMTGDDYADVLSGLMRDVTVQPMVKNHPLIRILTPEQAKLAKADVVIVGGVNDGIWPAVPKHNPWLSPDMMKDIGLPPPEENTGRAAFRFVQMLSNPEVLITRAVRSSDAPTVASPFLSRLMMVLKSAGLEGDITGKTKLLDIHTAVHMPAAVTPCAAPAPTPAVEHRPKELPVTGVEGLMRDPYSIYAKYILKLRRRSPLDSSPNVAEKGTYTHAALEAFIQKYPDKMPENAFDELLHIGRETFKERIDNPSVQSFWWPRFERIAKWFVKFEQNRREMTKTLGTEVRGRLEIDLGDGTVFTLTCIADRVDADDEKNISIIDYKTGSVPLQKAVALGFSPQLTLEGLIAYSGGFKDIEVASVKALEYWKLSGARPAAEVIEVKGDLEKLIAEAKEGLTRLVKAFNNADTPYLSNPRPAQSPRYQSYEHLSRSGEWGMVKKVAAAKKKKNAAPDKPKTPPKNGQG